MKTTELIIRFLEENYTECFTREEIANYLIKTYPRECKEKQEKTNKDDSELFEQLKREVSNASRKDVVNLIDKNQYFYSNDLFNESEINKVQSALNNKNFSEDEIIRITYKLREVRVRIGQNKFRKSLLEELGYCPFTKISEESLLIASHIKPWAKSTDMEKLDIRNGFIFTPTYDSLFDKGFISFKNDKSIILSEKINPDIFKILNIKKNDKINLLPIEGRKEYLEYHRDIVFKK